MRVVLDVNVVVSAVLSSKGAPRRLLERWRSGAFIVVIAEGVLVEVAEKLRNPKIGGKYGVSDGDVAAVLALFRSQAAWVLLPPEDVQPITGDPEDDYVLATATAAAADYLITGGKRLLVRSSVGGTRIVSPAAFLEAFPAQ